MVVAKGCGHGESRLGKHALEIVGRQQTNGLDKGMGFAVPRQRNSLIDAIAVDPPFLTNMDASILLLAFENEMCANERRVEEILHEPSTRF